MPGRCCKIRHGLPEGNDKAKLAVPSGLKRELVSVDETLHIPPNGGLTAPVITIPPNTIFRLEALASEDDYGLGEINRNAFSIWRRGWTDATP